jgi:hypothetical protein
MQNKPEGAKMQLILDPVASHNLVIEDETKILKIITNKPDYSCFSKLFPIKRGEQFPEIERIYLPSLAKLVRSNGLVEFHECIPLLR